MGQPAQTQTVTFEEFLSFVEHAEGKHELVNGVMYAMTGGTLRHADVTTNLVVSLHRELGGRPCRVRTSDAMVRTAAGDALYPDVVVTCGDSDTHPIWITRPLLVVEVLSEGTAAYDRGLKFEKYRAVESLAEYVLVDPDRTAVDIYRRETAGRWVLDPVRDGAVVLLSLDISLTLDDIYA